MESEARRERALSLPQFTPSIPIATGRDALGTQQKRGPTARWRKKEFSLPGNSSATERLLQLVSKVAILQTRSFTVPIFAYSSPTTQFLLLFVLIETACGSLYSIAILCCSQLNCFDGKATGCFVLG